MQPKNIKIENFVCWSQGYAPVGAVKISLFSREARMKLGRENLCFNFGLICPSQLRAIYLN